MGKPLNQVTTPYEPTPRELKVIAANDARRKSRSPWPGMTVNEEGKWAPDHPDAEVGFALLMEGLGTANYDFASVMIAQVGMLIASSKTVDKKELNSALALARGIDPRDEVEAMLASQMAAVQLATMTFARRLKNVETIEQQNSAATAFNKLAKTFAIQIEALKRYRSTGEQRVVVERVTVNEGGQAIVGNVSERGGVHEKRRS